MDARNERLVFELLVETSCQETNSQVRLKGVFAKNKREQNIENGVVVQS